MDLGFLLELINPVILGICLLLGPCPSLACGCR